MNVVDETPRSQDSEKVRASGPVGKSSTATTRFTRRGLIGTAAAATAIVATSAPAATAPFSVISRQEKVTITYWTFLTYGGDGPRDQAETQIIDAFMEQNPDIEIRVENTPWNELDRKLILTSTAGGGPDVSRANTYFMGDHARSGSLMGLDSFAQGVDKNDFILWDSYVYDGAKLSFPLSFTPFALFYRTDLFEAAGIAEPPKTWSELAEVAQALTTSDVWGYSVALSQAQPHPFDFFGPYVWAHGQEVNVGNEATYNNPAGVEVTEFINNGMHEGGFISPNVLSLTYDERMQAVQAGKVAMVIEGSHRYSTIQSSEIVTGKIGLAHIPGAEAGTPAPTLAGGWSVGIPKNSRQPEAAWRFIEHYTSPEMQLLQAQVAGDVPTRLSVAAEPWFETDEAAAVKFFADYLGETSHLWPNPAGFQELQDGLVLALQEALSGAKPAEQALTDAAEQFNARL